MSGHKHPPPHTHDALIGIAEIASILACSTRHVHRLIKAGQLPAPLRLGSLRRWRLSHFQEWLSEGCPRVREDGDEY